MTEYVRHPKVKAQTCLVFAGYEGKTLFTVTVPRKCCAFHASVEVAYQARLILKDINKMDLALRGKKRPYHDNTVVRYRRVLFRLSLSYPWSGREYLSSLALSPVYGDFTLYIPRPDGSDYRVDFLVCKTCLKYLTPLVKESSTHLDLGDNHSHSWTTMSSVLFGPYLRYRNRGSYDYLAR